MISTDIKVNTHEEVATLYINIKKIVDEWCNNHKEYQYQLSQDMKEKSVKLTIIKGS